MESNTIVAAVRDNYARSELGFYPCEPGWSFTVCNIMAATPLVCGMVLVSVLAHYAEFILHAKNIMNMTRIIT